MKNDPLSEGRRWLDQAELDLGAARNLAEEFAALACFHAQQAAEKALKAVLYADGERVIIGHSLSDLGDAVAGRHDDYEQLRAGIAKLDRYYIPTRYPNGLPPGTTPSSAFDSEDAAAAITSAAEAVEFVASYLTDVADPETAEAPDADS